MASNPAVEISSSPLADWFFISGPYNATPPSSETFIDTSIGVDSDELSWGEGEDSFTRVSSQQPVEPTIEEDKLAEAEHSSPLPSPTTPRHVKRNSYHRLSRLSDEARLSIQSVTFTPEKKGTESNRSSGTIKGIQINGTGGLSDIDFEKALRKFTSERDSFLSDLTSNAGMVTPNRPRARPKTQRILNDDAAGLKSGVGSLRRRISFRDMGSMKRQPSVVRQCGYSELLMSFYCLNTLSSATPPWPSSHRLSADNAAVASVRTSKRLSNYNSVIPNPQPLNAEANMHPLKKRFEPVLLDRYPPESMVDEAKRRGSFPDYVPMFAFPNDVHIVSADERPRSTWHGFAMTSSDNSRLYGICVIVWVPLKPRAAEELEHKCEEWRRKNMTDEERELASSLGERLAQERATLSRLLAKLPSIPSGTTSRENLEDDISAVEEKIGLMTDLLRPVRHGAASKIDGLTDGETGLWIPRSYGILGRDPSLTTFWKEWLKAVIVPMTNGSILRVPPSSPKVGMWQPLERYVINLCAEALSPISSKTQVEIAIRELRLFARKEAVNELPGSRNVSQYVRRNTVEADCFED